ncbi:uncharacterized protein LOC144609627 [Rhinoraja longicauda]
MVPSHLTVLDIAPRNQTPAGLHVAVTSACQPGSGLSQSRGGASARLRPPANRRRGEAGLRRPAQQVRLTESALKEKCSWQEQSTQKIVHLETQLKKLEQQLTLSQRSREELKAENLALASKSKDLQLKLDRENKAQSEGSDLSVNSYEGIEGGKSDPRGEHEVCRSKDGKPDRVETVLGIQVEVKGKIPDLTGGGRTLSELEKAANSVDSVPASGGDVGEYRSKDANVVDLETELRGKSAGSQSLEEAVDGVPRLGGKMGARLPEVQEEVKEESEAKGTEAEAMPGRKGEGLGPPTTADARPGGPGMRLKEVEAENRALQCELDDARRELESKAQEGQKGKRAAAELRRKLKQATGRRAAEDERAGELAALQTGRIDALEKALEQERAKTQEANEALADVTEGGRGEPNGDVQILQSAASGKIQRLGHQIARLEGGKAHVEEIIEAHGGAVNEKSRALLEYLAGKDVQSLELDEIAALFPNGLRCGSREKTGERELSEEKVSLVGTAGGREGDGGQEILLENKDLRLSEERLSELQRKCEELTREKEEEGAARRQTQGTLDDLQVRIHRETQQLTVALDAQGKNIEGLLLNMGEKDLDIQVLNGRLQSALTTLSSLSRENRRLKANSKTAAEASWETCANPGEGAVLERNDGEARQGDHIESKEKLGLGRPASSVTRAAHENTQRADVETVPGFHDCTPQSQVNPPQHDPFEESRGPLLNGPAPRDVPEVREVVAKWPPPPPPESIDRHNELTDQSVEPGGGETGSISSAGPPEEDTGVVSAPHHAAQTAARVGGDVESQRRHEEPGRGGINAAQNGRRARSSDGLPAVTVNEPGQGLMVLQAELAQTEPLIKEAADSPTQVRATEGESEGRPIEGVDGGDRGGDGGFEGEGASGNDLALRVRGPQSLGGETGARLPEVQEESEANGTEAEAPRGKGEGPRSLIAELNGPGDECDALQREEGQLGSEAGRARREGENLATAIPSGGERRCLQGELPWKREVPEDAAASEGGRAERRPLQGSELGTPNHDKALEGESRALEDAVESLKHLHQELEQAHFEKSVLQSQVESLQKAVVELNKEKINLQSRLTQRENESEDQEFFPDHLQPSGLHDDLLPMKNHRQGAAEMAASQLHADLMALRRAVREKSDEVDRNLLVYTDLLGKHQEPAAPGETRPPVAEPGLEPAGDRVAVARQPAVGRQIEEDQAETSRRSPPLGRPRGPSAGLNPAELAMRINPAQLAERIRNSRQFRQHLSVAFDETDYEPLGLPDVVQKGFADIPSGSFCPHILRRGTLNSTFCPGQPEDGNTD